jgi:hypothetical protein
MLDGVYLGALAVAMAMALALALAMALDGALTTKVKHE